MRKLVVVCLLFVILILVSCGDGNENTVTNSSDASVYEPSIHPEHTVKNFTDADELEAYVSGREGLEEYLSYKQLSCLGELYNAEVYVSHAEGKYLTTRYKMKDVSGDIIRVDVVENVNVNAEYKGVDDLRKYPVSNEYSEAYMEYEGIIYGYSFDIDTVGEGSIGAIYLPLPDREDRFLMLLMENGSFADYPTDGEETFISRLLNADTVASAKAELEKCILGE